VGRDRKNMDLQIENINVTADYEELFETNSMSPSKTA
jgi:hypothetical protein